MFPANLIVHVIYVTSNKEPQPTNTIAYVGERIGVNELKYMQFQQLLLKVLPTIKLRFLENITKIKRLISEYLLNTNLKTELKKSS